jgi:hypothetical protein
VCARRFDVLHPDRTGEETAPVGNHLGEGSDPYQRDVSPAYVGSGAAPPIPAGRIDQTWFEKTAVNFLAILDLAMIQRYLRECSPFAA